jgi:hypothetical protein
MTTVAANLQEMAADSACCGEGAIALVTKLHRIGDSIFGEAGGAFEALRMIEWLKGKRDRRALDKLPSDFDRDSILLLELAPDGLALWNGWGVRMKLKNQFYAIGSGGMSAVMAMKQGKSPADAVTLVPEFDEYTRGPVDVMKLEPKRSRK